jgi:D-2-hydroxyacid dehydrogenase (NADP+)
VKILIANQDPELLAQVRAISEGIEVVSPDELKANPGIVEELEAVFGGLGRDLVPKAKRLKWIQTTGAGVNGLITPELQQSDLIITNAKGIHAQPIAEHMFGMLLMVVRRLGEAWDQQKTRQWKGYDFGSNLGILSGKTLGLLGVGAIGGMSARVGKAFGMRVIGMRRTAAPHPDVDDMFSLDAPDEFYAQSDVIMNSAPLTERSHKMLSWEQFAQMKPGVIVINAGRGPTIDTEALMAALREGKVGAALLDVTDPEPLPEDHPLWTMENVFITPHYGGAHPNYNQRSGAIFLENLRRYLRGDEMINLVDKAEGY